MGLTGTLRDGTVIERMPSCEFESLSAQSSSIDGCKEQVVYRVIAPAGVVFYACEEHAQILWEADEALAQEVKT
jgi:hypothetical protein